MATRRDVKELVKNWLIDLDYFYSSRLNLVLTEFLRVGTTYAITFLDTENPILAEECIKHGLEEEDNESFYVGNRDYYVRENGKQAISILPEGKTNRNEVAVIWKLS